MTQVSICIRFRFHFELFSQGLAFEPKEELRLTAVSSGPNLG
jgi:hypothetical protein